MDILQTSLAFDWQSVTLQQQHNIKASVNYQFVFPTSNDTFANTPNLNLNNEWEATMAYEWCWGADYTTMAAFVDISIYTHDGSVSSYNDIHLHLKECRARHVSNDMEIDLLSSVTISSERETNIG